MQTTQKNALTNIATSVFPETRTEKERQKWNAEVLKYNMKRLQNRRLQKFTFWHYKAAQMIAGSWNFEDTLHALDTDMEMIELDAQILEREHNENKIPEPNSDPRYCGNCSNGWLVNHKTKTVKPCGCSSTVNEAYKTYVLTHTRSY